jgi:acetate CoA/acetoacetate CoA-transferase alpha subunit
MIEKPVIRPVEAARLIKSGSVVHIGGFLGCGAPDEIITAICEAGIGDLTIVCNDTAIYDPKTGRITGLAPLILKRLARKVITSHIGTNAETQRLLCEGKIEVELVPQGTLAERVRAAGYGLGGILTPTGAGTEVEEGKRKFRLHGKTYLLELPLPGDVAIIKAKKGDKAGNLIYAKTARNFNPLMASACSLVIAEVEELVDIGGLDPDQIHTPSIFVDYLVKA